ncbi:zeta toxin family protein [Saccharopolyspora indica]|uniref:zeta toxin family protein n=1 Tax=Saccharopolyspora indica TaxID=1229659 RepID=UPI0022EA3AAB|nr:zeta toxin family protein [Saccharopolyspora indica]MDA3642593.1 zeta toxin family protein [Saccharopolyspora indica]
MSGSQNDPAERGTIQTWLRSAIGAVLLLALVGTQSALPPIGSPPAQASVAVVEPLTDEEWAHHVEEVRQRTDEGLAQGLATDVQYTTGGDRVHWLPERVLLQREIVDELYARGAEVPSDGAAVFTGGLPGAGKTTALKQNPHIDPDDYLVVNSDDVKQEMCERGMIPELPGLAPMEAADLIQEESSLVSKMLADRAYRERKNIIWDITMSSAGSVNKRLDAMRGSGYHEIKALFLDVPVETSVERVDQRHRRGYEKFRNGDRCNGRYVPAELIRESADPQWGSVNRKAFEATKGRFDQWFRYDASGNEPVLVAAGEGNQPE